jgi:hypothetical protein
LVSVPLVFLHRCVTLAGRRAAVQHLCGNLQLDTWKALTLLGWVPLVSLEKDLRRAFAGAPP